MVVACYRFVRRPDSVEGFFSQNSASTDVLNALAFWQHGTDHRSFSTEKDEENLLVAKLSWADVDDTAGADLDKQCQKYGVDRRYLPE